MDPNSLMTLVNQRYILFYPSLANITGCIKAAVMLGHALFILRETLKNTTQQSAWLILTPTDWQDGTALSKHEQLSARKKLIAQGLFIEQQLGRHKEFTVDLYKLGQLLSAKINQDKIYQGWIWQESFIRNVLGTPVMFYKSLARLTDSISTGLYLSSLLSLQRNQLLNQPEQQGWFRQTKERSRNYLYLTEKRLRNARVQLKEQGILKQRFTKEVKPKQYLQIDTRKLHELLVYNSYFENKKSFSQFSVTSVHSRDALFGHVCFYSKKHIQVIDFKRIYKSNIQEMPFLAKSSNAQTVQITTNPNEKGSPIYKKEDKSLKQQQEQISLNGRPRSSLLKENIFNNLVLPSGLSDIEVNAVRRILENWHNTDDYQMIVDEWSGQLKQSYKPISNKLGYLAGMIKQATKTGIFIPTIALDIAKNRALREAREKNIQQTKVQFQNSISNSVPDPETRKNALATIKKLFKGIKHD